MTLTPEEQAEWNQNRQPLLYGVLSVLLALANVSVGLRIWVSYKRWARLKPDDYCMIAALVMSDGVISSLIYATTQGFGLHVFRVIDQDENAPYTLIKVLKTIWAYAVLNGSCFMTIKLAILLSYRQLFFRVKWFRIGWWFNLIYAILWTIASTLFYIFQCRPVDFYWTRVGTEFPDSGVYVNPRGHCDSGLSGTGAPIILNTVGDLLILLLPAPILFQLQVTTMQRLRLVVFFSLGLIAVAAGFVRFAEIFKATEDYTWTTVEFVIWSTVEEVVGIVCANIPMIFVYYEDYLHKRFAHASEKVSKRLSVRNSFFRSSLQVRGLSARMSSGSRASQPWVMSTGHSSARVELDTASQSGSEASTAVDYDTSTSVTPADSWEKDNSQQQEQFGEINVTRTYDVRSVSN